MAQTKKQVARLRKKPLRIVQSGPRISLRDVAYTEILRRIITLRYRPGAYINEAQVCADLKIGRTPVHMALERLSRDGMIEVMPRKGAIIRAISLDEVMAVIEARLLTEPGIVRFAAQRATKEQIERLQQIVAEADTQTRHRDTEALMHLDRDFHATIADAARNPVLAQQLKSLHERILRLWYMSLSEPAQQEDVAKEHREILRAIESRDPDLGEAVMREHIESFSRKIVRSFSDAQNL